MVIATIKIVVVQSVEHKLVAVIECLIHRVVLYADAWMEFVRVLGICYKQHVVHQVVQSVAQSLIFRCCFQRVEVGFDLPFRAELILEVPAVICLMGQEGGFHVFRLFAKELVDDPVTDIGLCKLLLMERQSVSLNLLFGHGKCGREMSQQSVHGM